MHMQELGEPWLRTEDFFKEKKGVVENYSWSRGLVFRQKFIIKYKSSMFASRDVCIHFGKKTWSHLRCNTFNDFNYTRLYTRHFNMESFKSAVPAIFLTYASTFFGFYD